MPPITPSRVRARPILGAPGLIPDAEARPVGAIGQSLGEFSERAKRAEEIEKKLTAGQVIIEIDTGRNLLLISGAVPGSEGGEVIVRPSVKAARLARRRSITPNKKADAKAKK